MAASNGNLPDSMLSAIPGGRLQHEPAAAWNAMVAEAKRRSLAVPVPDGLASSYRTYAQQVVLRNEWCAKGECENAAVPGTSNHGLGLAVDCGAADQIATIAEIGRQFGWAHGPGSWSDAPWEDWHNLYQAGHYKPPPAAPHYKFLPLKEGDLGPWVWVLRRRLRKLGYHQDGQKGPFLAWTGRFNSRVHAALVRFQKQHGLTPDGIAGPETWAAVKHAAKKAKERKHG
jgi:hypothetical protein